MIARTTWPSFARYAALVVGTLILLAIVYRPVRYFFNATGDVSLYHDYAKKAQARPPELPREYPPPSALIFLVPQLIAPNHYTEAFLLTAAAAMALTLIAVERLSGGGLWLLIFLALGSWGVVFTRYDIIVAMLTVLAFGAGTRRRWLLAQALLAAGFAFKLYPALLMPLVVVWQWRAERRLPIQSAVGGAVLVLVVAVGMWLIAPDAVTQMLRYHGARPLEFESVGASLVWLREPITAEYTYGSLNVQPSPRAFLTASTVLTALLPLMVYAGFLGGYVTPAGAWALVLLFALASTKVFSTQYLIWALPFVVMADGRDEPDASASIGWQRALWIAICITSSLVYPVLLEKVAPIMGEGADPNRIMFFVTLRNLLWLAACVVGVLRWTRNEPVAVTQAIAKHA
jgi:hypothetical protein